MTFIINTLFHSWNTAEKPLITNAEKRKITILTVRENLKTQGEQYEH